MQNIFMGWVVVYIRLWVAVYIRIYLYGRWWCIMCGSWCISTDLHLVYLVVVVYIYTKYLYLYCGSWCISTDLHLVYLVVVVYIYTKYLYLDGGWWSISTRSICIGGEVCGGTGPGPAIYQLILRCALGDTDTLHISTHIYVSLHRRTSTHLHIHIYASL